MGMEKFDSVHPDYNRAVEEDLEGSGYKLNLEVLGKIEKDEEAHAEALNELRMVAEVIKTTEKDISEIEAIITTIDQEETPEQKEILRKALEKILIRKRKEKDEVEKKLTEKITIKEGERPTYH